MTAYFVEVKRYEREDFLDNKFSPVRVKFGMKWWNYIDDETCKEKVSPVATVEGGENLPALSWKSLGLLTLTF